MVRCNCPCIVSLLLLLSVLIVCSHGERVVVQPVGNIPECQFHHYYQQLEDALVSNAENLYKLQKIFFSTGDIIADKIAFGVCVMQNVSEVCKLNANGYKFLISNDTETSRDCWSFEWNRSLLQGLYTPGQLGTFEKITAELLYNVVIRQHASGKRAEERLILLHLGPLSCTPPRPELLYKATTELTSWVCVSILICMFIASIIIFMH